MTSKVSKVEAPMHLHTRIVPILCLATGVLVMAQPAPDAAGVLAAAREALGGEQKLSAVKTIVTTGRTRQIRGNNLVPIEFEIAIDLPDKYVRTDEVPAQESDPTTVGFNGNELLQAPAPAMPPARAGGPPPPTPEQMAAARTARLATVKQDFARLMLGMFAGSSAAVPLTFTYAAKAEAPQGKADVLDVKGPGNFSARFFLNAETHVPIMTTWIAPAPPQRGQPPRGGAGPASAGPAPPPSRGDAPAPPAAAPAPPPESRLYYGDYREVNGLRLPFRLRRALGPDTIEETTFDGYKINGKIDGKKFEIRK
jgi:hypothetical protein